MRRALPLALILPACTLGLAIPDGKLRQIAEGTLKIAHPLSSDLEGARVVGGSAGGCGGGTRYVDVEMGYRGALSGKPYFMTVRYTVHRIDPCEVSTDVVSDTGPIPPVLLDNAFSSTEVGRWVCDELR